MRVGTYIGLTPDVGGRRTPRLNHGLTPVVIGIRASVGSERRRTPCRAAPDVGDAGLHVGGVGSPTTRAGGHERQTRGSQVGRQ
jgi:hypothetical protein